MHCENSRRAPSQPVRITTDDGRRVAGKVAYSPHTYGPGVHDQSYFAEASFPTNMPPIWDLQFGR